MTDTAHIDAKRMPIDMDALQHELDSAVKHYQQLEKIKDAGPKMMTILRTLMKYKLIIPEAKQMIAEINNVISEHYETPDVQSDHIAGDGKLIPDVQKQKGSDNGKS